MLLKTTVAIMQSKPCWWEQSESNSKCFCRLERRNYSTKYITELKLTDKTTTNKPQEILKEENRFYRELYTSTGVCSEDQHFYSALPEVSGNQRQSCEGLLTKDECLTSLAKSKSPDSDGLSVEFYGLVFWESLGKKLVDSLNHAFECGEFTISQRRGTNNHSSVSREE